MEQNLVDLLARALARGDTRRWLLRVLTAWPLVGSLAALPIEGKSASGHRRHHRQQPRYNDHPDRLHDERKKKKKKKKTSSPPPTCAQAGHTPFSGQACCAGLVLDGAGQCAQPAPPSCANSCSGCCNGEICVTATS